MQFSVVDLPQPEGPSRAMNSPCLIVRIDVFERVQRPEVAAERRSSPQLAEVGGVDGHGGIRSPSLVTSLGAADLLVPAPERQDHRLRIERQLDRVLGDQLVVFGPAELLDHLLALLRAPCRA